MKSFLLFLFFFGILLIVLNDNIKPPPPVIEYRYLPRELDVYLRETSETGVPLGLRPDLLSANQGSH